MPVDPALAGRTFPAARPYEVGREKIREFLAATGGEPGDGDQAPPTFPIVVAFQAMQELLRDPEVGIALHRVVHADQRFAQTRPVRAGDVLTAQLSVQSVRRVGGADVIATRTDITAGSGEHVVSAYATLMHRGEEP